MTLEAVIVVDDARDEGVADDVSGGATLIRESTRAVVARQTLAYAAVVHVHVDVLPVG